MERYLRILNFDFNKIVYDMCYQICKFQMNDSKFLQYRPSQLAACSIIISINIYRRDYEKLNKKGVFTQPTVQYSPGGSVQDSFFQFSNKICPQTGHKMLKLNLDIWNQKKVVSLSGYSIEMLIDCLSDLSNFIRVNLSPDRLEGFDLDFKEEFKN